LKQVCRDVGEELIPELLSGFEEDLQQHLQTIPTLREAEDVVTLTRAAHSLKSFAATFGTHRLSAIALTIETFGRQDLLDALYEALPELLSEMGLGLKHLPKSP
jgi:HPt (histidine-containing phosphotransfer) domain-containing protein